MDTFSYIEALYQYTASSHTCMGNNLYSLSTVVWFSTFLVKNLETSHEDGEQEQNKNSESLPQTGHQEGGVEEGGEEEEELYEEGQEIEEDEELCEETPEEEDVGFEWPAGVPQASEKDLAKLSHTEWVGVHFFLVI